MRGALLLALLVVLAPMPAAGRMRSGPPTSLQTLAAANDAARRHVATNGFEGARQVYAYEAGALYQVYASPSFVSTILLEPGETLNEIAAGDTARWSVSQSSAETAEGTRTLVLVKPQAGNLITNLVLMTDRRTYLIEAVSHEGGVYSAEISWSYPPSETAAPQTQPALHDDYRIRTVAGRPPPWAPRRVYDDGRRTWIEFDPSIGATDMPPLFIVTGEGDELTNYRVQGSRYMVDRVFDVAELRLGTHAPIIVRIERRSALSQTRMSQRRGGPS